MQLARSVTPHRAVCGRAQLYKWKSGFGLRSDVKAADDGGLALALHLGELHGVLGVFLFLELNGFDFLFHNAAFRRWLMVAEYPPQSRQNILTWWTVGFLDFVWLDHQER